MMVSNREYDAICTGKRLVTAQAQRQLQTFFDELKNGTQNYRTLASLSGQVAQEYRGRCVLELLQNAHDALLKAGPTDPRQISFILHTFPEPVLLIANSGIPFRRDDFEGICQLGQSPKDPNESVGNKGLGFRSVLEVCTCPEIWSICQAPTDPAFIFRFDPAVNEAVAAAARDLRQRGLEARSPFNSDQVLVDWSEEHLRLYINRLSSAGIDAAQEARDHLSPYQLPLVIEQTSPEIDALLHKGHVTVIRLRLDGGRTGSPTDAISTLKEQLDALGARAMVFLPNLQKLIVEVDGQKRTLERYVDSDFKSCTSPRIRQQKILVGGSGPEPHNITTQQFSVWTRVLGGAEEPTVAEEISTKVVHLPNQWPKVRRVVVGVAVEDTETPEPGVFVIFLPTDVTTGTAACINAPFYSSLSRREIEFKDPYNEFLLRCVNDLILDVSSEVIKGLPEDWRGRTIIDVLGSTSVVGGKTWRLIDRIKERAIDRDFGLGNIPLVLCDRGWRLSTIGRLMPEISEEGSIDRNHWRAHANFDVVVSALDGRIEAVKELIVALGGSTIPTYSEWAATIESIAAAVQEKQIGASWDDFIISLVGALPKNMLSAKAGPTDPLTNTKFLPTQDGRLLSTTDTATLFFQPVRGIDDAAEFVGIVPESLKPRIAFLHPDVRTQEGPQRRNTEAQKFLDGRFVRGFRREDLLRDVVLGVVPSLPVAHGTKEAVVCSELLSWALKLLGKDEPRTLIPLLGRLPVPCYSGWYAMREAVFGPGWRGKSGDLLRRLAEELGEVSPRILAPALLPPNDERWGTDVTDRTGLFEHAGIVDGLRLQLSADMRFNMEGYGNHQLPENPPAEVPLPHWEQWRTVIRSQVKPHYDSLFEYMLSAIWLLPEVYQISTLTSMGRDALSQLLLKSFSHWPVGWEKVELTKMEGNPWSTRMTSPLKYFLSTEFWLQDREKTKAPLPGRWLVPESLIVGQAERFSYLDPLSVDLAHTLSKDDFLKSTMIGLGLNEYPIENEKIGPELLDALAKAWSQRRVPPGRFDVFLGQVRDAWRHLDPQKGLPSSFLVLSGRRSFTPCRSNELVDVYLPDNRDRTRSLIEHEKKVLEMQPAEAGRLSSVLMDRTPLRCASMLEERIIIDGDLWADAIESVCPLDDTKYAWLPPVLLSIAAHGGIRPAGAGTKAWQEAAGRLRRARLLECETIIVQLVDDDRIVASSEPNALWMPGEVFAIKRTAELSYESFAPAAQSVLDRQDLLKDLRLVLGALAEISKPTSEQIEAALDRAEIDAQAFADVRQRWTGTISMVVDRIRPVLVVSGVRADGLEAAATDLEHLAEWLRSKVPGWSVDELINSARLSRDDAQMGRATWRALGDIAELPLWNAALGQLGNRYVTVRNRKAIEQTAALKEQIVPYLRAFARHIAISAGDAELFRRLEDVPRKFVIPSEWAEQWWEIPLEAVLNNLAVGYNKIPGAEPHLIHLSGSNTLDGLKAAFQAAGIAIEPNPYETASLNYTALTAILSQVHDFYRAWCEIRDVGGISLELPAISNEMEADAYLRCWTSVELMERVLTIIGDVTFKECCHGCTNPEDICKQLGLDEQAVNAHREERLKKEREDEQRRRTFDVAGILFEVGTASYQDLFKRLNGLPAPNGPRASKDEFSPLSEIRAGGSGTIGGGSGSGTGKSSHRRPPAELRELVGVVGEMHAYRYLKEEFGKEVVTRDAWVSELRLKVMPLVQGETDHTSDGHGYDFCFRVGRKMWLVEVKATKGDDTQFDLGISEIQAASRYAGDRYHSWRILRVGNALTAIPQFEWLPNPFEEGFRNYFRLQKAGMAVSYARKKP